MRVTFLDVGQGDAALVEYPGGTLLIDGGPPEAGPRVVEALRQAGSRQVDWLIGTHPHADHIGGLVDVLEAIPVRRALDPGYDHGTSLQATYLRRLRSAGARVTRARAGQEYDLGGGARLEILAPEEPLIRGTDSDANNNSIVARLAFGEIAFLFTGDMEREERARLLRSASAAALRARVLKVAHHGSHDGTDAALLEAVRPEIAVIGVGAGNEYGHPHRETLELLREAGVRVYRTDRHGDVTVTTDGRSLEVRTARPAGKADVEEHNAAASREGPVIGNAARRVFHAPDCRSLPAPENRVRFPDAEAAEAAGYRPHAACMRVGRRPDSGLAGEGAAPGGGRSSP